LFSIVTLTQISPTNKRFENKKGLHRMLFLIPLLSTFPKELVYLDPGSGSLIIQMVIAAIVGGGLFLRAFWGKLTGKNKKTWDDLEESQEDKED
jgi:hypothetical protein